MRNASTMSGGAGRKNDRMPKIAVVAHQRPTAAVAPAAGRATTYHGDVVCSSGTANHGHDPSAGRRPMVE